MFPFENKAVFEFFENEVVDALTDITLGDPLNSIVEVAGPIRLPMNEFVGYFLKATTGSKLLM